MSQQIAIPELSNRREVTFVATLLELGGPHRAPEAAMRAGYATTVDEAERAAAFLLGAPRIGRAISNEVRRRFDVGTATAFNTLLEVCGNNRAPANARISAAQEILNRSSIGPVVSRSLGIRAEVGIEEMLKRLDQAETAQRDGKAPEQVIDGVAHIVTEEPEEAADEE